MGEGVAVREAPALVEGHGSDQRYGTLGRMGRRVVAVAIALGVIGVLGLALGDRDEPISSYSSAQALGRDISAHGIGCSRVYPSRLGTWADHDAAGCQVGSASLTLHVWKGVSPPINLGEAVTSRGWLVPTGW